MSKMQSLQQALDRSIAKPTLAAAPSPTESAAAPLPQSPRQSSRKGQVNISAWLDVNYKASLRLVQARKGPSVTLQDIMAEALNDLFAKYDVPVIRPN